MLSSILAAVVGVLVIAADRISKIIVTKTFLLYQSKPFLKGLLDFYYIKNSGAAWGILGGKTISLIILTIVLLVLGIYAFIKFGRQSKLFIWAFTLILSGGIGNLIDRIFCGGEVIDFLQFAFWQSFPVFNIADCSICVGAGLLILYFILDTYKERKEKDGNNK